MVFSSYIFLFLFLPLFLGAYYLTPFRWRSLLILAASYLFYGWWRFDFLALLVALTGVSHALGLQIHQSEQPRVRKRWLVLGVTLNLAALAYFKYANFGIESLNSLLGTLGAAPLSWTPVLLPIGLSFFVFHAISYLVDIFRGEARPTRNVVDFAAFIALFPHLIAGPVLRYNQLAEQFRSRVHSFELFSSGALRFMVGFCKKVLIADSIAPIADAAFALSSPTAADAWLGVSAYALQLYFDFSGYSDMAIGLAAMMGFRFPENFNHPYLSRSITEFWRRWHISLSTWLREYLYISLGGSRRGRLRTYRNLFLTMLLGGLWHGAGWTFVLWGAWHGGVLALERFLGEKRLWNPVPTLLAVPGTLVLVLIGWVLFRAHDLSSALTMYGGMLGLNGLALSDAMGFGLTGLQLLTLLLSAVLVYAATFWRDLEASSAVYAARTTRVALLIMPLFVLAVFRLSAQNYSPFLYFQF